MAIEAFIRFRDKEHNEIYYGKVTQQRLSGNSLAGTSVGILSGSPLSGFEDTGDSRTIGELLCPLKSVPLLWCVGLNYRQHAEESGSQIASCPVVFMKPPDALAGPGATVSVHPEAQPLLDYEGELTVIIGRDAKNVPASEALSYVLGYTNGNDVSARNFQARESGGGQASYAKSMDGFAPIGPAVIMASQVPDPQKLRYTTKVNGAVRQTTGTDDMIWTVEKIIEHLSRGTTLRKGTAIMTGTPSGVGLFMKPKGMLKDGDVVEVEIEGFGKLSNTMKFEK